jgi:hypothetical protein
MSLGRAHVAIENLIADHVALSFGQKAQRGSTASTAAQIRSRITDQFQHGALGPDQDNSPSAILALRDRIAKAFPLPPPRIEAPDRFEQLARLRTTLESLRSENRDSSHHREKPVHWDLLLERQQLALRTELTEGFGRLEMWLVSIATLILVMLRAIDFIGALPILAAGIGRSWYLDRQCTKRHARIAEIDALVEPSARSHS